MRESVGVEGRKVRKSRWIGVCAGIYTLRTDDDNKRSSRSPPAVLSARSESVSSTAQQPAQPGGRDLPGPPAHGRRWGFQVVSDPHSAMPDDVMTTFPLSIYIRRVSMLDDVSPDQPRSGL
jgi:hypothetical protein